MSRRTLLGLALATTLFPWARPDARAQGGGDARVPRVPLRPVEPAGPSSVRVTVKARNSDGKVFCAMWRGPDGYPTKSKKASHEGVDRRLVEDRAVIVFENVAPGEYAIACFHDENANNDLDVNFLFIPVEGTGASNDAQGFMGPPSYDDARFSVGDHELKRMSVPMHYVF